MSISGKILYNKVRNLRSELSNVVTPELLDKICQKPAVQPFLKWFCENVSYVNVLSDEEVQLKNKLQETGEWLEGPELDLALQEATADCPDLLELTTYDDKDIDNLFAEHEILRDSNKEDESYIETLQNGIRNLKKLEAKLEEDIETEEECLVKENIEVEKAYQDCSAIVEKFDTNNHEFFKEVACLLDTYAEAAENKGIPLVWTQMPLELFTKKVELYNHYLHVHIKRQFKNSQKEEEKTDSNYVSLIDDSQEKRIDNEKLQELAMCKANLTNANFKEISAKVQEESYAAMFDYVQDIYNSGNLKVPRHSDMRTEISELINRRDFLEENVSLLHDRQLTEIVQRFAEFQINKVLREDAISRSKRAKNHLEKLENLRLLVREHGYARVCLLCILMEMEFHRLTDVYEFVSDAFHYLTSEYSLSAARCERMQQQQNEYTAMLSSPTPHNSFHKHFISMISDEDDKHQLNSILDKYNNIIDENKTKKQTILESYLKSKIHKLETLEEEVKSRYLNEIQQTPTHTYKPISFEIETNHAEAVDSLQKLQADVTKIRNQMKERLKLIGSFEREKSILWQRFLADPQSLRRSHKEMKQRANKSCFNDTIENE
ncbi:HAUS augmin-like complex subunit 3 [Ceratina calcarata]|uniref:HAUS augmin-like complex subunit 3 n=1 Tax=Ceratina calcarata TaxID=156304 RepID=A0AAJ7N4A4_9HYME|nr:HAUS augmin-like complex subunit 3 [Ceratina calcarata]XP_017876971.1 HAUS augmin-like complex subunit 3 [Ceratina calcarata]